MFGLFRKEKAFDNAANDLYISVVDQSRSPIFYTNLGVPDTFEGRLDLMFLHLFFVMNKLRGDDKGEMLSQALFDTTFKHIELSLREMGVGDVGIPKRMKKMMPACNGRLHAYKEALDNTETLKSVLDRNIYDKTGDMPDDTLNAMQSYFLDNVHFLENQSIDNILRGVVKFSDASLGGEKSYGT